MVGDSTAWWLNDARFGEYSVASREQNLVAYEWLWGATTDGET
jgi:hypothetical protein